MSGTSTKNIEIECLRGVSICMVFIAHVYLLSPHIAEKLLPYFNYVAMGMGVDLFFCISGYVVSKSYFEYFSTHVGHGTYWPAAGAFWLKRCFRLLPSAWLWVLFGIFCALFFNKSGKFLDVSQNIKSALSILSFTANISHMYDGLSPNNAYWSLSLEEQFYLLFPLTLLMVKKDKGRLLVLFLLVVVQFPFERNIFGSLTSQYLSSFRTDGFAWGILIDLFSRSRLYKMVRPKVLGRYKPLGFLITLVLIYLLAAIPAQLHQLHCAMGLMAICAAALVWLSSYSENFLFGYPFISKGMKWLGSRSYAIYLIHLPAFKVAQEIEFRYLVDTGQTSAAASVPYLLVGSVILILALAELNFRIVEEPLRRKGVAFAGRKLKALSAPIN